MFVFTGQKAWSENVNHHIQISEKVQMKKMKQSVAPDQVSFQDVDASQCNVL